MSTVVAFLAECRGAATLDEQMAYLDPTDHVVVAGKRSFNKLTDLLVHHSITLRTGDRVKLYDLSSITLSTPSLIRAMTKILSSGITLEIISLGIIISPDASDNLRALLEALDNHQRYLHGIKTHPADRRGRKFILNPSQLSEIKAKLGRPGATASGVAKDLGVARSTLFNYLDRYDRDRRFGRGEKIEKRRSQSVSDDTHVSQGEVDNPAIQNVRETSDREADK